MTQILVLVIIGYKHFEQGNGILKERKHGMIKYEDDILQHDYIYRSLIEPFKSMKSFHFPQFM